MTLADLTDEQLYRCYCKLHSVFDQAIKWDWPTMYATRPTVARVLRQIITEYRRRHPLTNSQEVLIQSI